jgi:DNA uptake protein ComE-like DNA-binding protein
MWFTVSLLGAAPAAPAPQTAAQTAAPAAQAAEQTEDAEDQQVVARVCGGCHAADSVKGTRRSRSQWEETIDKMVERGAKMTDPEYEAVMRYLLAQAGRVNVNVVPASELVAVLRISNEDAKRIRAYREGHGRFADFESLVAVRDIDVARLKQNRVAIEF